MYTPRPDAIATASCQPQIVFQIAAPPPMAAKLVQRDIRPGHDVDRVLLEQFGVEHTFDAETRDLLERHREMLERDVPPDDADRRKVEALLVERLGDLGGTLRDEREDERGPAAPIRPEERLLLASFLNKNS